MNTTGLVTWIKDNVIPLAILIIAVGIMFAARKKDHKSTMTQVGIVLVGLMLAGLALGGKAVGVGTWLSSLVFG